MLPQCFYLVALLTTVITLTFSDVTLYPDSTTLPLGPVSLKIRNLVPRSVDWPATNVTSNSSTLAIALDSPLVAKFTVEVFLLFFYVPAKVEVIMSGGMQYAKNMTGGCAYDGMTRGACSTEARVIISGTTINRVFANVTLDVCDTMSAMISSMATMPATASLPTATAGSTDLAKSLYFQKFVWGSAIKQAIGAPASAVLVAKNAMHVSMATLLPFIFDFDSANPLTSATIDSAVRIAELAKKLLNIATTTNANETASITFMGGTVTVPTAANLIQQVIAKEARAALKTFVPAGASLEYDFVVNDFRCTFFNTICSMPADGGVQIVNSRVLGGGDAGAVLTNVAGSVVDAVLTNITSAAVRATSAKMGSRLYLSPI